MNTQLTDRTPPWAHWFNGKVSVHYLPGPCVEDCTRPGPADDAVERWVKQLQLEAPPWLLRQYLKGFGAYDSTELCDHQSNLGRLLWLWAFECKDAGGPTCIYLG